eukprot:jgi/Botrbrau1/18589/Bobra.0367s0031.1
MLVLCKGQRMLHTNPSRGNNVVSTWQEHCVTLFSQAGLVGRKICSSIETRACFCMGRLRLIRCSSGPVAVGVLLSMPYPGTVVFLLKFKLANIVVLLISLLFDGVRWCLFKRSLWQRYHDEAGKFKNVSLKRMFCIGPFLECARACTCVCVHVKALDAEVQGVLLDSRSLNLVPADRFRWLHGREALYSWTFRTTFDLWSFQTTVGIRPLLIDEGFL